jgi:hypothetical protein
VIRFVVLALTLVLASVVMPGGGARAQQGQPVVAYPAPFSQIGATATLNVTAASSNVQLGWAAVSPLPNPAPNTAWVCNTGAVAAAVNFGASAVTAATTNFNIPAGSCNLLATNGGQYIAGITASGSTTLTIATGNGDPAGTNTGTATAIIIPSPLPAAGITPTVSSSAENNHVLKASGGNLYGVYAVNLTATAGFLVVVNATSAPADGAILPLACVPLPANGIASLNYQPGPPAVYSTGITAVITSASNCFTKTTGVITGYIGGAVM